MTLPITPGTWTLDPANTDVSFTIKNMIFKTVTGRFTATAGTATVDDDSVDLHVTLDARTFDTGNAKRDEHVRSDDFFDAGRFPTIEMRSTTLRRVGDRHHIEGTVTAKDVTTPVTLAVTELDVNDRVATFTATADISRYDLGLSKMPNLMIGENAHVTVVGRAERTD